MIWADREQREAAERARREQREAEQRRREQEWRRIGAWRVSESRMREIRAELMRSGRLYIMPYLKQSIFDRRAYRFSVDDGFGIDNMYFWVGIDLRALGIGDGVRQILSESAHEASLYATPDEEAPYTTQNIVWMPVR